MQASGKLACIHVRHWSYKVCKSRDVLGLHVASIPVEAKKDLARQRKKQRAEGRACAKSWAWGSIVSTGAKREEIAVVGAEWASIRVVEILLTMAMMLVKTKPVWSALLCAFCFVFNAQTIINNLRFLMLSTWKQFLFVCLFVLGGVGGASPLWHEYSISFEELKGHGDRLPRNSFTPRGEACSTCPGSTLRESLRA